MKSLISIFILLLILLVSSQGCVSETPGMTSSDSEESGNMQESDISSFSPGQDTETTIPGVDLIISKVFFDGLVPQTESDEYVEIKNRGNEPVDLAGWVLVNASQGYPSFTFPTYVIQPGESVRVYTNEVHPEYGGFSFGSSEAVWNNDDPDTAALFNFQGEEVFRRSY